MPRGPDGGPDRRNLSSKEILKWCLEQHKKKGSPLGTSPSPSVGLLPLDADNVSSQSAPAPPDSPTPVSQSESSAPLPSELPGALPPVSATATSSGAAGKFYVEVPLVTSAVSCSKSSAADTSARSSMPPPAVVPSLRRHIGTPPIIPPAPSSPPLASISHQHDADADNMQEGNSTSGDDEIQSLVKRVEVLEEWKQAVEERLCRAGL
jgi:hypothetical protein